MVINKKGEFLARLPFSVTSYQLTKSKVEAPNIRLKRAASLRFIIDYKLILK